MVASRFDLKGKVALITGGAGLLGFEHASALLECDCRIVLTDISEQGLKRAWMMLKERFPFCEVYTYLMDVSEMTSIKNVSDTLGAKGIHVDILINNAAIDPKVNSEDVIAESSRLENFSREQWDLQIAVGLTGAFQCSQVFGALMATKGNGGVILNIASDLSVLAPDQRLYRRDDLIDDMQPVKPVTYSVIKAGLIGLTRYLATYWADKGIRCNALSPGGVINGQGEEFIRRLSNLVPLGRMARRDEYRAAVQFLASEASSYMSGQNIIIDGGRSAW